MALSYLHKYGWAKIVQDNQGTTWSALFPWPCKQISQSKLLIFLSLYWGEPVAEKWDDRVLVKASGQFPVKWWFSQVHPFLSLAPKGLAPLTIDQGLFRLQPQGVWCIEVSFWGV